MFTLCDSCYLQGFCAVRFATVPSVDTIKAPAVRLRLQNYLVDLDMSAERQLDFLIDAQRDFPGRYRDQNGKQVAAPGIGCWLNDGAVWWLRDQIEAGRWQSTKEVKRLRREATARWRFIYMVMSITENVQPPCSRG